MNKELKFTIPAGGSQEFSYPTGIDQIAITNYNGNDDTPGENIPTSKTIENAAVAHFTDAASAPLLDLVVDIKAVQSGTGDPSPENERPISGFTVVNVGDISDTEKVKYFKGLLDGTYNFINMGSPTWTRAQLGDESGPFVFFTNITDKRPRPYGYNCLCSSTKYDLFTQPADATNLTDNTVGVNCNSTYVYVRDDSYTDATVFKTAMNGVYLIYELATPTTPTITPAEFNTLVSAFGLQGWLFSQTTPAMPASDNTIYGAKYDILTGKFLATHNAAVFNGSEIWESFQSDGVNQFYVSINNVITSGQVIRTICDKFKSIKISERTGNYNTCYSGTNVICFNISDMTLAEWKTWLADNNVTVVYELATPLEYNMGANEIYSLHGENNIFANTGNIEKVTYITGKYEPITDLIDDKTAVFFDADYNYSTYTASLINGVTSNDIKNYLITHKYANIVIRVRMYSSVAMYRLREYSPYYFATFATVGDVFDDQGTKKMAIGYLRLDLTQETSDFATDSIIVSGT